MSKKYDKCRKASKCWIKDCLYSKTPKSFVAPDGRRVEGRRPVQLFRFPPEPERYAKWIEAIGPILLDSKPGRLCKHHFGTTDFKNGGEGVRLLLEKSAVPSLSHDYPRRPMDPVKIKKKPTVVFKNEPEKSETNESNRKSPTPSMRKVLGIADEEFDDYDSDTDVDDIVESELGFKLQREEGDYNMLSDAGGDHSQPMSDSEEFDDRSSDEEVQIELMKLMAKKSQASPPSSCHSPPTPPPPPPSTYFQEDQSLFPLDSPSDSRSSDPSASEEDDTSRLFQSFEQIYRSLQSEVQVLTKENLFAVMKMAKKMDDDLKKNDRLVLKPRVFKCYAGKR